MAQIRELLCFWRAVVTGVQENKPKCRPLPLSREERRKKRFLSAHVRGHLSDGGVPD